MKRLQPVQIVSETIKGMQQHQEDGNVYYTPELGGEGEIEVRLENVGPYLVFFPRTSGNASIDVVETTGALDQTVFNMRGVQNEWSPLLEGYHFLVRPDEGKPRTFRIRACGPGAQIWRRGDGLFYAIAP